MKRLLPVLALCLMPFSATRANSTKPAKAAVPIEEQRKDELLARLCVTQGIDCGYARSILNDSRIVIIEPPPPTEPPKNPSRPEPEKNPYFRERFGLATPEALERCRAFIEEHALTFDAAYVIYGVPREVICGHFRIETRFGIRKKPDENPLGSRLAINALVSLYARRPKKMPDDKFKKRQAFAFIQTKDLIRTSEEFGWDLFKTPGSSTGAVGLLQFEPSSFWIAVDGDGDGTIDLFNADDSILSLAHYLVIRGFDEDPEHQRRAIYEYYGGNYKHDPRKYYMNAVLKYADEMKKYLAEHPLDPRPLTIPDPAPLQLREDEIPVDPETASQ